MAISAKQKLTWVTITYWFLLLYMIAALVWWYIALQNQNNLMANMLVAEVKQDNYAYIQKTQLIEAARKRKNAQYIGEGVTFLALILIGAVFVFRATRKQIKLQTQEQNFMMAITHELKTPIAVAKLNLETLQKHNQLDEAKQQKLIANTIQETNRLNSLCNNILFASQLDANGFNNQQKVEIQYSELVWQCVADFKIRFPQKNIIANIDSGIYIVGDDLLLQLLTNNLLDNANKYANKNTAITIHLQQIYNEVMFKIADEGVGIDDAEKQKIFDKFYRTGNENTRTAKGTGLGLYLCKKIVNYHGGKISISNNTPQGSIFTATFKASNEV
jgi:two-component system, OmpR family, sensor histidine kinase CiaH